MPTAPAPTEESETRTPSAAPLTTVKAAALRGVASPNRVCVGHR